VARRRSALTVLVLDCSTIVAWVLDEEAGEQAAAVIDRLADSVAIVPDIWPREVANALVRAERQGRLAPEQTGLVVEQIEKLPVALDETDVPVALHDVLDIARQAGLTAYDSAYLELAIRLGLPLATLDRRLAAAARARGVEVL
jgi:predicted nucleic acid-binding protein